MSNAASPAKPRFEPIDRAQCFFQTVDIEELVPLGHRARLLWNFLEKMDLSRFAVGVKAVEHRPGRDRCSPQLLIAIWLYAYSRGISSAREIERQSKYEPGLGWLTGLEPVNHHTLSDFRVQHGEALQEFFVQVLGILTLKKLVTLERVTVDGTKIRACVSKKTFSRESKIREHLAAAKKHLESLQQEEVEQEKRQQAAAKKRAARQRVERLESAVREMEQLQKEKQSDKLQVSTSDPDARFMHTNDNGTAPCYNVQLATDGANKLFVGVSVSKQANDAAHLAPAVERVKQQTGQYPEKVIADGDYTNRATVIEMNDRQVDFYGSWKMPSGSSNYGITQEYRPTAFRYDPTSDQMICPEGKLLHFKHNQRIEGNALLKVYAAEKQDCLSCCHRMECSPKNSMERYGRTVSVLVEDGRVVAYHDKMSTQAGKDVYKTRAPIAEFPHAWLKTKFNFVRFRCRGLAKVAAETMWACLAYNLQNYFRLTPAE